MSTEEPFNMTLLWKSALFVALSAVLYQFWISDLVFVRWGYRRAVKPLEDFHYRCRRIEQKELRGCGNLWLDEQGRILYAVCGHRKLVAIYIDEQKKDGTFPTEEIQTTGLGGRPWDGSLDDISSFSGEHENESTLRFWFVNHRFPVDSKGQSIDIKKYGANITIDAFEHTKKGKSMRHYKTVVTPKVHSPGGLAFMGADSFVINNRRSTNWVRRQFDGVFGGGDVVYYDGWDKMKATTTPARLREPQGLLRGKDDRIYLGSASDGMIRVYQLKPNDEYVRVHVVRVGMPIESLSVDSEGSIWVLAKSKYDPEGKKSSNAVFRVRRANVVRHRFFVTKMLEDAKRKMLVAGSAVSHDVQKERLFVGSMSLLFPITVEK